MTGAGIPVPPFVVVMAIRYGMGRMTYANDEASRLARQHWAALGDSRRTIRADADRLPAGHERDAWAWLVGPA